MPLVRTEIGNYYDPADPGERGYERTPRRRSVTDDEAEILSRIATDKRVLEIGTGLGVSTRALAQTAAHVLTVDPDPWVQDPGLPNVTFARSLPEDMGAFDLAFIDGNHKEDAVVSDIEACAGIPEIVLHDTYLPEVKRAIARSRITLLETYETPCQMARFTPS